MSACDTYEIDLVDAASGEISAARREALDGHLRTCEACRRELAALGDTVASLEATASRPEDLHLASFALRTADRAERFRDRSLRGAWWALLPAYRLALGVSGFALAASLALTLRPMPPPAPAPIASEEVVSADPLAANDDEGGDDLDLDAAFDALDDDELDSLDAALDYVALYDPT